MRNTREVHFRIKEIVVVLTDQGIIPPLASFYSAKSFYTGCWEVKASVVCPSPCPARHAHCCNSGMNIIGTTNHMKSGPQKRLHAWYYKSGQNPMTWEITGPSGETIVIMLSSYAVKLSSEYLFTPIVLNFGQGSLFFPPWVTVN